MRILALMSSRGFYGAERANLHVLHLMVSCGVRVDAMVRHEPWPENLHLRDELDKRGVSTHHAAFPDYPSMAYKRYWPRVMLQLPLRVLLLNTRFLQLMLSRRPDVVLLNGIFHAFCLFPALLLTRLPSVYYVNSAPELHNAFYRLAWRWVSSRVSRFVCESDFIARKLHAMGVPGERVTVIRSDAPHRVDCIPWVDESFRCRESGQIFCFIGQLTYNKGLGVLLDAFKIVHKNQPSARLVIAGRVSAFFNDLKKKYADDPFMKAVNFYGSVEDVHGLLMASTVHVAPSYSEEAYGLVVIEAKKSARPSIVFDSGGISELIDDRQDGYIIRQKTKNALAEVMMTYCRSPQLAIDHGLAAKASLEWRLKTHEQPKRWLAAFKSVISKTSL